MTFLHGMTDTERNEMYEDVCASYQSGQLDVLQFTVLLGKLRYNATDIADAERFYRPEPPENGDGD